MKYRDILREIGKRLGDSDLDRFKGIVSQSFIDNMCQVLIAGEGYSIEEVPDLIEERQSELNLENQQEEISITSLLPDGETLKLLDIYQPPQVQFSSAITLKEIDEKEFKRMYLEVSFRPTSDEVFWFRRGNKVYFIAGQLAEAQYDLTVMFQFLKNPDPADWEGEVDLLSDLDYSRHFVYKIADETVKSISALPAFAS